jgi:hypothetical protein
MAIKTYSEQLEEVQDAISKIQTQGQSYSMDKGGVNVALTRAHLPSLYDRERYLLQMVRREQNGGGIGVRFATPV